VVGWDFPLLSLLNTEFYLRYLTSRLTVAVAVPGAVVVLNGSGHLTNAYPD
jgi:hypothetical protein